MSVNIGVMTLPGVLPQGENPLPHFRRQSGIGVYNTNGDFPDLIAKDLGSTTVTLPYRVQDRYTRDKKMISLKTIVLENECLRATFTPELGGKLWSLFDKELGRELLMANPVVQPGNLAIRNAWTSGGIEWNFGSLGHTYFTCDNVWAAVLKDNNGEEFLRIYEFERAKECVWQADFHLPTGSHQLYSHIRVMNPGKNDTTTYWWTNIAIPEDGGTRVLSSSDMVVVVCDEEGLTYEKLPFLSVMPGDLSYPSNASRSFDYFFQPDEGVSTTWEGGVNKDGYTFYDRSTAPLVYHKMFCWGNHRAGYRWQEFLSRGREGDYIEIQAGYARSQLHDKAFPAGSVLEWTQCYGGTKLDADKVHGVPLEEANAVLGQRVESLISEKELIAINEKFKSDALLSVPESAIVHAASGWGALELCREVSYDDRKLPSSVTFPDISIGIEQYPWYSLLKNGVLPEATPDTIPVSWMTSPAWRKLVEESLKKPGGKTWFSMLHYGNMLYETWDFSRTAAFTVDWSEKDYYEAEAEAAWKESVALTENVWALRNLAMLEYQKKNYEAAFAYYDRIMAIPTSLIDFCFAAEYMGWLNANHNFEKAWQVFETLPEEIRKTERVTLCAATCGIRLGKVDFVETVFRREFGTIREGETSLSDIWFQLHARKLALENGITNPTDEELEPFIDEAWKKCPPPHEIDFRMSYVRDKQYRST